MIHKGPPHQRAPPLPSASEQTRLAFYYIAPNTSHVERSYTAHQTMPCKYAGLSHNSILKVHAAVVPQLLSPTSALQPTTARPNSSQAAPRRSRHNFTGCATACLMLCRTTTGLHQPAGQPLTSSSCRVLAQVPPAAAAAPGVHQQQTDSHQEPLPSHPHSC
jgi:hypothetical protein